VLKKTIPFLFLLLLSITAAKAQPAMDTIQYALQQKPKPFAKLDSRNSFINNSIVNIFGAIAGVNFGKKISFGLGYNQLYHPPKTFDQDIEYINALGKPYFISSGLRFYYISLAMEYSFYQTKHWEISMPLQIGVGRTYYQYDLNGIQTKVEKKTSFVYEPTISVDYKIVKWVGIGADFGYRFFVSKDKKLNSELNSPIVTIGLAIYYSEIYKSIFPNSKLAKKMQ
jgi:hypothetical protein